MQDSMVQNANDDVHAGHGDDDGRDLITTPKMKIQKGLTMMMMMMMMVN